MAYPYNDPYYNRSPSYGYQGYQQGPYTDPNQNDPNLSKSLTNHFYKLSTQTNMLIFGYVLLMAINHMILGDIIYDPNNTFDDKKKNWFFSTVFFCTIINCFILLWLKEKKRPVLQASRKSSKIAPVLFALIQIIILGFSLTLFLSAKQKIETKKKIMTVVTFVALNFSVILSTWGFSSSVCSIARADQFGSRTVLNQSA